MLALSGFLAALLLYIGLEKPLVSMITFWFCFASGSLVYVLGRKTLRLMNVSRFYLGFLSLTGTLALLMTLVNLL